MDVKFDDAFRSLTGNEPFPWQTALYERSSRIGPTIFPVRATCQLVSVRRPLLQSGCLHGR